jgi:hypothetical protein
MNQKPPYLSALGNNNEWHGNVLVQPEPQHKHKARKTQLPQQATSEHGASQHSSGGNVKPGDTGMGPASLVKALKEMKPVGLGHALPCEETTDQTEKGVTEQGRCHE